MRRAILWSTARKVILVLFFYYLCLVFIVVICFSFETNTFFIMSNEPEAQKTVPIWESFLLVCGCFTWNYNLESINIKTQATIIWLLIGFFIIVLRTYMFGSKRYNINYFHRRQKIYGVNNMNLLSVHTINTFVITVHCHTYKITGK